MRWTSRTRSNIKSPRPARFKPRPFNDQMDKRGRDKCITAKDGASVMVADAGKHHMWLVKTPIELTCRAANIGWSVDVLA